MMKVGDVLVSDDIRDREFVCNLEMCKGACCVEGDYGAPLDEDELQTLEDIYPIVKPYLTEKAIKTIEKEGTHTIDDDGEYCTPVVEGRECVYAIYDKKGILKPTMTASSNGRNPSHATFIQSESLLKRISKHLITTSGTSVHQPARWVKNYRFQFISSSRIR
jgi:hypothetical protein